MAATPRPTGGTAVGIDGYRGGWVAARLADDVLTWETATIDGIATLIAGDAVVGIDMPIGLLDAGERPATPWPGVGCRRGVARVHDAPGPCLELGRAAATTDRAGGQRRARGQGVSRQALAIGPRILALERPGRAPGTGWSRCTPRSPSRRCPVRSWRPRGRPRGGAATGPREPWRPTWRRTWPGLPTTSPSTMPSTPLPPCGPPCAGATDSPAASRPRPSTLRGSSSRGGHGRRPDRHPPDGWIRP